MYSSKINAGNNDSINSINLRLIGVYVQAILGAFGVIIFERLGWVTGQV